MASWGLVWWRGGRGVVVVGEVVFGSDIGGSCWSGFGSRFWIWVSEEGEEDILMGNGREEIGLKEVDRSEFYGDV